MRYLLRKMLYMVVTLLVIVTATFFLMKMVPGDPFSDERGLPPAILEALYDHYGLNDPLHEQYFRYIKSILHWDLGPSFIYKGRSVNEIISDSFPVSAQLGLLSLLVSVSLGVILGTIAALRQNQWQDYLAMFMAIVAISVPSFVLATLLQYGFAMKLGWLPVARWGSWLHCIMPTISLAALPTAFIARLTRSSMLEVLQAEFIRTARSKGLTEWRIVTRHALPNAILPVITYLGQMVAGIFVGSFIVERIFGIPGLGQWFVSSIINRDYTTIMGTTVFYSVVLVLSMFLVDLVYVVIDPRIRLQSKVSNND